MESAAIMNCNEVVLLLDCGLVRITIAVLLAARGAKAHLVLIPTRTTGCLQPLDVYVFAYFKRSMRAHLLRLRINNTVSLPPTEQWITTVSDTCREVLCGRGWKIYFARCRYCDDLAASSPFYQESLWCRLSYIALWSVPCNDELALCFPRRRKHTGFDLFVPPALPPPAVPLLALPAPPAVPIAAAPAALPAHHFRILSEAAFTGVRARPLPPLVNDQRVVKAKPSAKAIGKFAASVVKANSVVLCIWLGGVGPSNTKVGNIPYGKPSLCHRLIRLQYTPHRRRCLGSCVGRKRLRRTGAYSSGSRGAK